MNRLRELRKAKGLTIRELGENTNISYPIISYIENGERPFTQTNLEILCKYFNVSADFMLGRTNLKDANVDELNEFAHLTVQERYILDSIKTLTKEQLQELIKYIEAIKIRDALLEVNRNASL